MQTVDLFLYLRMTAEVVKTADVSVKHSVCEAEVFFVSFTAETVCRYFMYEFLRQTEFVTDSEHLSYCKVGKWRQITGSIAAPASVPMSRQPKGVMPNRRMPSAC